MAPCSGKHFWPPHGAWLYKARRGEAWGKWLQPCRRRYFTVDFEEQVVFYSKREGGQRTSELIPFASIACAISCKLDDSRRSTSSIESSISCRRSVCALFSSQQRSQFTLKTLHRTFQLAAETDEEVDVWIEMLNAAHRMGKVGSPWNCADLHGIGGSRASLCSSTMCSEDSHSLACAASEENVGRRSSGELDMHASLQMSQRVVLSVVRAPDELIEIECELSDTIQSVKEKLQQQKGFELEQQCLDFDGKRLEDQQTLSSYGIPNGTMLHLFLRLYSRTEKRWIELLNRLLLNHPQTRSKSDSVISKPSPRKKKLKRSRDSIVSNSNQKCEYSSQSENRRSLNATAIGQDKLCELHHQSPDDLLPSILSVNYNRVEDVCRTECGQSSHHGAAFNTMKKRGCGTMTRRRASKLSEFSKRRSVIAVAAP